MNHKMKITQTYMINILCSYRRMTIFLHILSHYTIQKNEILMASKTS